MIFIVLLALTTLAVAVSAAFFSVYGLAHLFTGAIIPVIIMGASLEAGKLMAASYLYRFWDKTHWFLKTYLCTAVVILMLITSMGIFGFLTAAYQQDTLPLAEMQQKIELYQAESDQLVARREQIDKIIADVGPNYVRAKQRLIADFADERTRIDTRVLELTTELQELRTTEINVKAKVGPIMFIAEVVGKDPSSAVFWFTIILISVFDPLAVGLTIATNHALRERQKKKGVGVASKGEKKEVDMGSLKAYISKEIARANGGDTKHVYRNPAPHAAPPSSPSPTTTILLES